MRRHRPMGLANREKYVARKRLGPHSLQIFEDGISNFRGEWKFLDSLVLQPSDADLFIGPVQVIQCESTNLPYAQTVYRQKQNDCTIPNMARTFCVEARNQTSNLFPTRAFWKSSH